MKMIGKEWERALMPDKPPDDALYGDYMPQFASNRAEWFSQREVGPMVVMRDLFDPSMERYIPNPYHTNIAYIGSFRQFLMEHFRDSYVDFLRDLIERGDLDVGKRSNFIPNPDSIRVNKADVQRIDFYRKSCEEVYADVIMSAEVSVFQNRNGAFASDQLSQWFRVRTYSVLSPEEQSFNNLICIMIYDRGEPAPGMALDEYLVPYTSENLLDSEGTAILSAFYPEALDKPCRIEGTALAERMNLDVVYYRITPYSAIRGQMYFEEREITVINGKGKRIRKVIPANTIVIDLSTCEDEDGGLNKEKLHDTIIHECFHAYRHRLFYLGQKLYNEEIGCLSCSVSGERAGAALDEGIALQGSSNPDDFAIVVPSLDEKSPIDWIEWQANKVTPRIRMPARTTTEKIEELYKKYHSRYPNMAGPKLIGNVVIDLARFFGVSKQSAKLRMIELGYSEAKGVLNYVNGAYVENHTFAPGSLGRNQTFTIEFSDAFSLYSQNVAFQKRINSGRYQYVDGHFCLSDSRFLYRRNGELHLTTYAKSHMDECCLIFTVRYGKPAYIYREGTLQKEASAATAFTDYVEPQAEPFDFRAEAERLSQIIYDLPMSPNGTLKAHMDRKGYTIEKLVAKSGVSGETIKRLRNKADYRTSKTNALAICFGLQLEPLLSGDWLQKVGISLSNSPDDILYNLLLNSMYRCPVSTVNSKLQSYGLPPLSKGADELEC